MSAFETRYWALAYVSGNNHVVIYLITDEPKAFPVDPAFWDWAKRRTKETQAGFMTALTPLSGVPETTQGPSYWNH